MPLITTRPARRGVTVIVMVVVAAGVSGTCRPATSVTVSHERAAVPSAAMNGSPLRWHTAKAMRASAVLGDDAGSDLVQGDGFAVLVNRALHHVEGHRVKVRGGLLHREPLPTSVNVLGFVHHREYASTSPRTRRKTSPAVIHRRLSRRRDHAGPIPVTRLRPVDRGRFRIRTQTSV